MLRQDIRVTRDAEKQPAFFVREQRSARHRIPLSLVPEMPIRMVDTAGLVDVFCGRKCMG
jgi:hypothetical protein